MNRILLSLWLIIFLTGCAPMQASILEPSIPVSQPTAPASTKEVLAAPTQTTGPGVALLDYQQSGGIAGRTKIWTIYSDGKIQAGESVFQVEAADAAAIHALLVKDGITALAMLKKTPSKCADCILMTVTLYLDGKTHTFSTNLVDASTTNQERKLIEDLESFLHETGAK